MREAVRQGSELLTTITNDAWYGESSAPFQHFEMAAMRAIEQGRYLVRAANTGISGIVDPYGRVLARTQAGRDHGGGRRGALRAGPDALCHNGRPCRARGPRPHGAGPHRVLQETMALVIDDLIRRSTDLLKRAADLRSYL